MFQRVRFYGGTALLYVLTIGIIGYALLPAQLFSTPVKADTVQNRTHAKLPPKSQPTFIYGKPTRIVISNYSIDLPVDDGTYNATTGAWTLSPTHAQYAVMTSFANNLTGNTLIYGHGTDAVFAKLGDKSLTPGTLVQIYTDNNHIFTYRFRDVHNVAPSDTSIFDQYGGPAMLTVQTCTGSLSEWRTMFQFDFEKATKQ